MFFELIIDFKYSMLVVYFCLVDMWRNCYLYGVVSKIVCVLLIVFFVKNMSCYMFNIV